MRAFDAPTHKYTHARMHSETDTSQLAIERGSELTRGSADRTSSSLARSLCGPLPCLPPSSSWPRPTVAVGRVATAAAAHLSDTLFLPLLSRSGGRWVGLSLAHPTRPVDSLSFSSQASFPSAMAKRAVTVAAATPQQHTHSFLTTFLAACRRQCPSAAVGR